MLGVVLGSVLVLLAGCKEKDRDDLIPSIVPKIEWASPVAPEVVAWRDSLHFHIRYTDGDGDLGTSDPNSTNVLLVDTRFPIEFGFRLPKLAPDNGNAIPITGTFRFSLPQTILKDETAASELAVFAITVTDRAGNISNTLNTPPIRVRR